MGVHALTAVSNQDLVKGMRRVCSELDMPAGNAEILQASVVFMA